VEKKQQSPVIVIGALNADVCGVPARDFQLRDSNPGGVTLSAGGVGHNIARHLARAGIPVALVAAMGDDDMAALLTRWCKRENVDLRHAVRVSGASSTYLAIHGADGDMIAAVNDMALLERLTPETLSPLLPVINAAPLCVVDANPPQETLEWLAEHVTAPMLLDPVSGFKAERVKRVIGRFAAVKPNRLEAERFSGENDPARAAAWFLARGVEKAFISLGSEGVYYADARERGYLPAVPIRVSNATGAGDAMVSGIARGMLHGTGAEDAAQEGLRAVTDHLLAQGGVLL